MATDVVLEWNQRTLDAIRQTGIDPLLASRVLAITQAAVYDSVNAIDRSFAPYFADVHASRGASLEAAAAQAAHDTLAALFPSQAGVFGDALEADLADIPPGLARQGVAIGQAVAQQILDWRSTDGFDAVTPYTPGTDPGDWQPTPPSNLPALGPQWPLVTPFAITAGDQFRPAPPPALDSAEYAAALDEVRDFGRVDSAFQDEDQTEIAFFWRDAAGASYALGHWNTIAREASEEQGLDLVANARLLALVYFATTDAVLSAWNAKYAHDFWRPVTAIQMTADPTWTPPIGTPNFPSYTSAHSTVSSAAAAVLTSLFGPDYHFTTGSEGLPDITREFDSFNQAAAEAGQSRVYGGIHFQFDNQAGLASGQAIGQFVVETRLLPVGKGEGNRFGVTSAFGAEGVTLLLAAPSNASKVSVLGERQDTAATAPAPADHAQPISNAEAGERPVERALYLGELDQALADWDDSPFTDPLMLFDE